MPLSAEILTTGDELLRGDVVDTNATWLATRIAELGIRLGRIVSVGDELGVVESALRESCARCDLLLVSGGLGPTDDDRTTEAVARAAGVELELQPQALEALRARFARAGYPLTPNNEKQARIPRGAVLLPNDRGTAPGFLLRVGRAWVACMPGVPLELKAMFDAELRPRLLAELGAQIQPALVRSLNCFGLGESQIDHRLQDLLPSALGEAAVAGEATVHYRASFPEVRVIFVARGARAAELCARLETAARERLGSHVYGVDGTTFSEAVVAALRSARATLALAESCTGGLAGDLVTQAAGSSDVFQLGVITYSNEFKRRMVGVPEEVLARHGAVSRECALAMARGVRALAGSSYGVAISGIAGPGGGSDDKPVGTVHFALASERGVRHLHRVLPFERQRIKVLSAYIALALVLHDVQRSSAANDPLEGRWSPEVRG
jgi:nicotinamide-nucleotide amidase